MHREVTGNSDQLLGDSGELLPDVCEVKSAKVRMGSDQLGKTLAVFEKGDAPSHFPDFPGRPPMYLGNLAQRSPRLKTVVIRHHRGMQIGVAAKDVLQHLVALIPGKIQIDVGRVLALQVEKALEDQLGGDRVYVGDTEAVADDRVGNRSPATMRWALPDDVPDNQEIVGESFSGDNPKLQIQPVSELWRHDRIAPAGAGERQLSQL